MTLLRIILATSLVSVISLIGIVTLLIKEKLLKGILFVLVGFSAGALIGSVFFHLLPEAFARTPSLNVSYGVIAGMIAFFLLERYFHWRHCHNGVCDVHAFTYLNLAGDGLHNFIDGMVIAASFVISSKLGVATTLAIILHEIPQELGDFGVLLYGGFSKKKALLCNFLSALMAMGGAVAGYFIAEVNSGFVQFILPMTAGGFLYIAMSDLIPEIHKEPDPRRVGAAFAAFLTGLVLMVLTKQFLPE
ncbi:MAG: ZIP family metal transporter [Candidatus Omnitrophica bacterium]|nr:ZIP family metal transporter [Candidatus Omnitrophota bacterium]